ncbi:MAG: hypothetical protein RL596_1995 [Bacteroidota bacterium]
MNKPIHKCLLGISVFCILSCAKIPTQSVQLASTLQAQGAKMNELNIALINALFAEKKMQVNTFLEKEYTPTVIDKFFKKLPNQTFTKAETTSIVEALLPEINKQRDDMLQSLEQNRIKLITKLNNEYLYFVTGSDALKNLLLSATKLDDANKTIGGSINKVSGSKINIADISKALDRLLLSAGDIGSKINTLNNDIQLILEN